MEILKLSTIIDNFLNEKIIVMFMYLNNLKKLRLDNELKQEDVAYILNCKRATYSAWERKRSMIPLPIADKLALYYHVSLAYILGLEKNSKKVSYQKIDYNKFLENILLCKIKYNHTYEDLAEYLKCNKSTVFRYFNGKMPFKIDILIRLSKLYRIDLDSLCGRK